VKNREVRSERYFVDDAEVVIVAFGIVARIVFPLFKTRVKDSGSDFSGLLRLSRSDNELFILKKTEGFCYRNECRADGGRFRLSVNGSSCLRQVGAIQPQEVECFSFRHHPQG
jgi:hypothetical protein